MDSRASPEQSWEKPARTNVRGSPDHQGADPDRDAGRMAFGDVEDERRNAGQRKVQDGKTACASTLATRTNSSARAAEYPATNAHRR